MSFENPENIIRSWNLQGSFSNSQVTEDKLVPRRWKRIRTVHVKTWREEQLNSTIDWGVKAFSYFMPESLRVVASMFLEINLPALDGSQAQRYKAYPGMYAIKELRFLSAGTEAYKVNPELYLRDYMESLTDEECKHFADVYLGGQNATSDARTILVPILLPNSTYLSRKVRGSRGNGIFPAYTGSNRIEMQITLCDAAEISTNATPASIQNQCKMMVHQVEMNPNDVLRYSDVRGAYSVINRRFTEVTAGWQSASANTVTKLTQVQPLGTVTELFVIAVPAGTEEARREIVSLVPTTRFSITADSITQKSLNSAKKCEIELYSNGYCPNTYFPCASRIVFAAFGSDSHKYSGGYNMSLASQIQIDLEFAQNVDFKVYAVQLQRTTINSLGLLQSTLD